MNENTSATIMITSFLGAIVGGIAIAKHFDEKEQVRDHEYEMEKLKKFNGMSPEDRKEILLEEEKTKQAKSAENKALYEKKRIDTIKNLIDNPIPAAPVGNGTGSINIKLN